MRRTNTAAFKRLPNLIWSIVKFVKVAAFYAAVSVVGRVVVVADVAGDPARHPGSA